MVKLLIKLRFMSLVVCDVTEIYFITFSYLALRVSWFLQYNQHTFLQVPLIILFHTCRSSFTFACCPSPVLFIILFISLSVFSHLAFTIHWHAPPQLATTCTVTSRLDNDKY